LAAQVQNFCRAKLRNEADVSWNYSAVEGDFRPSAEVAVVPQDVVTAPPYAPWLPVPVALPSILSAPEPSNHGEACEAYQLKHLTSGLEESDQQEA